MMRFRKVRLAGAAAAISMLASSCYYVDAFVAERDSTAVPWFCNPTAFNSVTGPGMGTTNWYAGTSRSALNYTDCKEVGLQFDKAQAYAAQYPTAVEAEAAGFRRTFNRIPGMGTHHGLDAITPALLADPNFDPLNPIIPGIIDDVFDPAQPEFLQYDGNGGAAPLVGMSYYVRTTTGQPPEGFVGNNDWWHHHPTLCMDPATAIATLGVNTTDAVCASRGGINVHLGNYYMLHVWVVPDMELRADIHAPMHPCIGGTSTIFDMNNPCHNNLPPAPGAPADGGDPVNTELFCSIGLIEEQWAAGS